MTILGIDMGWDNSVSCLFDKETGEVAYEALASNREAFEKRIKAVKPDLVVIEAGPMAGWVRDLCQELKVRLLVLNTNDEPWRWSKIKKKTDRKDALKLTQLAAFSQVSPVHVPERSTRQWRQLIIYRETVGSLIRSIKNRIRALLLQEEMQLAGGAKAWSPGELAKLKKMSKPLEKCQMEELWRGMIGLELDRMQVLQEQLAKVEQKLDQLARKDARVALLMTAPGVGVRTAEAVVAMVDVPERFGRGREVACYTGLTPRKYQSGNMDRDGHISRAGNGLVRKLLNQAAWVGIRSCSRMQRIYEQVKRKSPKRSKTAVVAVSRHLVVWLWAMLRDGQAYQQTPAQMA